MTTFCKNYHGMQTPCDAGVDFDTVAAGQWEYPCYKKSVKTCSQVVYPTAEEEKARSEELRNFVTHMANARQKIVEQTQGRRGVSGSIECPMCQTGKLHYTVAHRNGHIHAQCSTPGCLSWLE
jgi:hypothetical protein